jgi:hypothetical protein
MSLKKHTPEGVICKLRETKIVLAQEETIADACRWPQIS